MKLEDTYHFQQVNWKHFASFEMTVHEYWMGTQFFSAEQWGYRYVVEEALVGGVEHSSAVFVVVGPAVVGLGVVEGE